MSAAVINLRTRKPWRRRPTTKNRLAAIERHRSAMAAYRDSSMVATIRSSRPSTHIAKPLPSITPLEMSATTLVQPRWPARARCSALCWTAGP
jgi:hypothetical protein